MAEIVMMIEIGRVESAYGCEQSRDAQRALPEYCPGAT